MLPQRLQRVSRVRDGAELDIPGRLCLLHGGGHTPGSSMLVAGDARVAFAGDELSTLNMPTGEPGPQALPDSFNRDPTAVRRELSRLEEIDTDWIAPGHSHPTHSPAHAAGVVSPRGASLLGEGWSV